MRTVLVPFGTRPEIVKLSPVIDALKAAGLRVRTVFTGQHSEPALAGQFLAELDVRADASWLLEGDGAHRLAMMTEGAERELSATKPDLVLLLGDTNTVPAFCLAARRNCVPVAHIEAGLRSYNQRSMEELNRKVAAACASLHFAPTEMAARFLVSEGAPPERVHVVGNPVIDVLRRRGAKPLPLEDRSMVTLTAHRATNVDDPGRLARLVELARRLVQEVGPVVFPLHPRTKARLEEHGLSSALLASGAQVVAPLSHDEMLGTLARSKVLVTDSGGMQEEAAFFWVPVVVLRRSTPRWEGVANGSSVLTGVDVEAAVAAAAELCKPERLRTVSELPCPYGDGHAAERIAAALVDERTWALLLLEEPDLTNWSPSGESWPVGLGQR